MGGTKTKPEDAVIPALKLLDNKSGIEEEILQKTYLQVAKTYVELTKREVRPPDVQTGVNQIRSIFFMLAYGGSEGRFRRDFESDSVLIHKAAVQSGAMEALGFEPLGERKSSNKVRK